MAAHVAHRTPRRNAIGSASATPAQGNLAPVDHKPCVIVSDHELVAGVVLDESNRTKAIATGHGVTHLNPRVGNERVVTAARSHRP
jgi:hypothetical protein